MIGTLAIFVVGPAQVSAGDSARTPLPLPPLNAKVVEFARSHLGEPVGDGICATLAIEAIKAAGAQRFPFERSGDYVWGEPVADLRTILPGDILQFRDAVFTGTRTRDGVPMTYRDSYAHHTAIVAQVADKGRLVTIYQQNVVGPGEDPADAGKVRATLLRMTALHKGGKIWAYRPVPRTGRGDQPGDSRPDPAPVASPPPAGPRPAPPRVGPDGFGIFPD